MQRILMFCSNPIPGGTARVFCELVNALHQPEFSSRVEILAGIDKDNSVTIYREILGERVFFDVIPWERIRIARGRNKFTRISYAILDRLRYLPVRRRNILEMRRSLVSLKVDGVVIHNGGYPGDRLCMQLLTASRRAGIKKRILVLHNYADRRGWAGRRVLKVWDRYVSRLSTALITVSDFSRRMLEEETGLKDLQVIYNGLPRTDLLSLREKQRRLLIENRGERVIFGMIGNFEERKGHYYFLRALNLLLSDPAVRWEARIIGNIVDENYYQKCVDLIDAGGLREKVKMIQEIYSAGQYAECFDVVVFPSCREESFGLISLEAMMYGKPVIAFDCGGIPEVVKNGENGIIVKNCETGELADAMRRLAADPGLRDEMGENAIARYEMYFKETVMAERYSEVLLND